MSADDLVSRLRAYLGEPPGWDKDRPWVLCVEALLCEAAENEPRLRPIADDFMVGLLCEVETAADEIERLRTRVAGGERLLALWLEHVDDCEPAPVAETDAFLKAVSVAEDKS